MQQRLTNTLDRPARKPPDRVEKDSVEKREVATMEVKSGERIRAQKWKSSMGTSTSSKSITWMPTNSVNSRNKSATDDISKMTGERGSQSVLPVASYSQVSKLREDKEKVHWEPPWNDVADSPIEAASSQGNIAWCNEQHERLH